jgi:hypothetical protein
MSGQPLKDMREYISAPIKIRFNDNPGVRFYVRHSRKLAPLTFFETSALVFKGKTADLYYDPRNQTLYKFFLAKKKKNFWLYFTIKRQWEIVKNIVGFYPAKKEFSGNRLLHLHGFHVAEPLGMGFVLSPAASYRCLLIFSYIQNTSTLRALFEAGISQNRYEIIRQKVIDAIDRMIARKIRFRDFTINNILVDAENTIYWIDTRADQYLSDAFYKRAKARMLTRFIGSFKQIHHAPQPIVDDFTRPIRRLLE